MFRKSIIRGWGMAVALVFLLAGSAGAVVVYETTFDSLAAGYTLSGQDGWMQENGSGCQGVQNAVPEGGNYATLGYVPPDSGKGTVILWRPVQVDPLAMGRPVVWFHVWIWIASGTDGDDDAFYWAYYNQSAQLLAALGRDPVSGRFFVFDGVASYDTGVLFAQDAWIELVAMADFEFNNWSAYANSGSGWFPVFEGIAFHGGSQALSLGDIDALWMTGEEPGDNWMVFDDYRIRLFNRREAWYHWNFFLLEEQITPEVAAADGDFDGYTLDEECAFGGDPYKADAPSIRILPGAHSQGGNAYLTLSFVRNTQNHLGFQYVLEETGSLSGTPVWTPLALEAQKTGNATLGMGFERCTVRGTRRMTGSGSVSSGFLRMRIVPDS